MELHRLINQLTPSEKSWLESEFNQVRNRFETGILGETSYIKLQRDDIMGTHITNGTLSLS